VLKALPRPGREFVRRLSVRKPGSSRPVPTPAVPRTEDPRVTDALGSDVQTLPRNLISTVTETKQGVTPGKKTPGPAKYFITLQRSGLPAGASRCLCDAADVDLSDAWVGAHDARMTPTNENRTNEEAAPTTAFVARFAFHARAHQRQVARSAPFHDRARDAATS
jgi:hypothetical protein